MDCGQCCLVPPLVSEKNPVVKYCEEPPACAPCLPRCTKVVYCRPSSPSPPRRQERRDHGHERRDYDCCRHDLDCCHYEQRDQRHQDRYDNREYRKRQDYHHHDHPDCCHDHHHHHHSPTRASQPKECYVPVCKPIRTKYVIPCYRYEDGRIVRKLPVTAFKRNGMQDQEHSKMLGTANFLQRYPRDISIECDVCTMPIKVCDPAKVPRCDKPLSNKLLRKKPINVSLEDIIDD